MRQRSNPWQVALRLWATGYNPGYVPCLPSTRGSAEGQGQKRLGRIVLCPGCAVEMLEMDMEAWENYREEEATHFMSITEALEMARSKPETPPEEKRVWRSHKWRDILNWMQLQERTVTVAEVAKLWKATPNDIRARLNQFARDGIVERMDKGGTVHYRIKEEACIN